MKVVALLPMKGNSERVPNKNLKDFCGRPLYHKILDTLLESKYIDEIIINTDGEHIKEDLDKNYKGRVVIHDRPAEIIGDFVSMNKIIEYDINKVNADIYVQTHSTNPLLLSGTLDNAIEKMMNRPDEFDSIFSVTKVQTRLYDAEGKPSNHNPLELLRTQDLPPLFEENSSFYIFTKQSFEKSGGKRIGLKAEMFEMDKVEAIDIDQIQDFIIAESIYKLLR